MDERVILVDKNDREIGTEEKLVAHKKGLLHRAFSIYIFDKNNNILLQKRNSNKYHSGGLWSNTCCSHPKPNEDIKEAVHRRLKEEMGFDTDLKEMFTLTYKIGFENGLEENEFLHIYVGFVSPNVKISPNKKEVEDIRWVNINKIKEEIRNNTNSFTYWFCISIDKVAEKIKEL